MSAMRGDCRHGDCANPDPRRRGVPIPLRAEIAVVDAFGFNLPQWVSDGHRHSDRHLGWSCDRWAGVLYRPCPSRSVRPRRVFDTVRRTQRQFLPLAARRHLRGLAQPPTRRLHHVTVGLSQVEPLPPAVGPATLGGAVNAARRPCPVTAGEAVLNAPALGRTARRARLDHFLSLVPDWIQDRRRYGIHPGMIRRSHDLLGRHGAAYVVMKGPALPRAAGHHRLRLCPHARTRHRHHVYAGTPPTTCAGGPTHPGMAGPGPSGAGVLQQ